MIESLKIKSPLKIFKLEAGLIFQSVNNGLCLVVGFPLADCVMRLIDRPEALKNIPDKIGMFFNYDP